MEWQHVPTLKLLKINGLKGDVKSMRDKRESNLVTRTTFHQLGYTSQCIDCSHRLKEFQVVEVSLQSDCQLCVLMQLLQAKCIVQFRLNFANLRS